jgi:hypothetical protein
MMDYEHENFDWMNRDTTKETTRSLCAIREIRAIRGSLPELDHGFHGFHGFSGRSVAGSRSRSGSVAPGQTQSNQSKVSSRFNPPSLKLRRIRVQSRGSQSLWVKPSQTGRMQQKRTKQTKLNCHARHRHQGKSPSLPSQPSVQEPRWSTMDCVIFTHFRPNQPRVVKPVALSQTQSNQPENQHPVKPCDSYNCKLFIINSLRCLW